MNAKLPNFLKFKSTKDLIRIGKNNDGGYLVSEFDINNSEFLLSLGINDDWSFEKDFLKHKSCDLLAYDGSVSTRIFFNNFIKSLIYLHKPLFIFKNLSTLFRYMLFFKGNKKHIKKYVAKKSINFDNYISFKDIFLTIEVNNVFIKIDIEGSEYYILDKLISIQNRISGLIIEFHDFDLNIKKIKSFIDKFELSIAHIHGNNYAPIWFENSTCSVIEVTFTRNKNTFIEYKQPHEFDMPNNQHENEIIFSFK